MPQDPLAVVSEAVRTVRAAEADLAEAVELARRAVHTWQEIGDLLGTSRQAAFQRFGRPIDPRTGEMIVEPQLPDALRRAVDLAVALIGLRWADVRREFDDRMLDVVSEEQLGLVWAQVAGAVGRYERMGEPHVRAAGGVTAVRVPLHFEAGEQVVQVSYRADGKVVGLWIRPADNL